MVRVVTFTRCDCRSFAVFCGDIQADLYHISRAVISNKLIVTLFYTCAVYSLTAL